MLICVASLVAVAGSDYESLGPGRGAWLSEDPQKYGLDAKKLAWAAANIRDLVPERYCLLVARNGKLIHESYFANSSETLYESDSVGKVFTAALMGVPMQQGLLDIDTPIRKYGVKTKQVRNNFPYNGLWNKTGVDYFENVTVRQLLAQSSGFGLVPPGSLFTYNSDDYIQHLSYTISAVAERAGLGSDAVKYASEYFATPLGIPDYYAYDNTGIPDSGTYAPAGDISAGGGQVLTCRDLLRVGQLLLNRGMWRDGSAEGKPKRLIPEKYAKDVVSPQFPHSNPAYGLLHWLNTDMNDYRRGPKHGQDGLVNCCAPRWGGAMLNCTTRHFKPVTEDDDDRSGGDSDAGSQWWLPTRLARASAGARARAGNVTHTACTSCCAARPGLSAAQAAPYACADGVKGARDTTTTVTTTAPPIPALMEGCARMARMDDCRHQGSMVVNEQIVGGSIPGLSRAPKDMAIGMGNFAKYLLVIPSMNLTVASMGHTFGASTGCDEAYDDAYSLSLIWDLLAEALTPTPGNASTATYAAASAAASAATSVASAATTMAVAAESGADASVRSNVNASADNSSQAGVIGSCTCLCPPGQGFGKCFNIQNTSSSVGDLPAGAHRDCSTWEKDPASPAFKAADYCPNVGMTRQCLYPEDKNRTSPMAFPWDSDKMHACTPVRSCSPLPTRAGSQHNVATMTFTCQPRKFEGCVWSNEPCVYTPFFPP